MTMHERSGVTVVGLLSRRWVHGVKLVQRPIAVVPEEVASNRVRSLGLHRLMVGI